MMDFAQSVLDTIRVDSGAEGALASVAIPAASYLPPINATGCNPWYPLNDAHENPLNPCFVAMLFGLGSLLLLFFGAVQLAQSLFRRVNRGTVVGGKGFRTVSTYGSAHEMAVLAAEGATPSSNFIRDKATYFIRVNSVFLQGLLYLMVAFELARSGGSLSDAKTLGFAVSAATVLAVLLPLHAFEVRSRVIPSATLLAYWSISIVLATVVLVQQLSCSVQILPLPLQRVDVLLFLNSVSVFTLEYSYYQPTAELVEYCEAHGVAMDVPDLVSRVTYTYVNPLLNQSVTEKSITEDDIIEPIGVDKTEVAAAKLSKLWEVERLKKKPMLIFSVFRLVFWTFVNCVVLQFLESVCLFAQPQFLRLLINFFGPSNDQPLIYGFAIAVAMFLCSMIKNTLFNIYVTTNFEAMMRSKGGLMSLIYAKCLALSPELRAEKTTGEIINLMSVDVSRVQDSASFVLDLIDLPIRLIFCFISLNRLLGPALWGGVLVLVVMMPVNAYLTRTMRQLYKKQMVYKDKRTKLLNDILTSIKSIKLYSWEQPMLERLREVRNNQELANLKVVGINSAFTNFFWGSVPFFVSCISFALFVFISEKPLTSDLIFPALALFSLLGEPIFAIPAILTGIIELNVAMKRVTAFLMASEIDSSFVKQLPPVHHRGEVALNVENCNFYWTTKVPTALDAEDEVGAAKLALSNVTFQLRKGELACVVGRVGSGKSTMMQALLSQLACGPADASKPSSFERHGDIAYCAQVPWIMNSSVRENILFGKRYEEEYYQKTVNLCQLLEDFDVLPDGDATLVGEKGISLSGGQKARLSLARAVYKRADIYILDDILSAVDAHVGRHITDEVLSSTGMLATKTIVLATNSVPVLSHSKNIVLLDHCQVTEHGSFDEVVARKSALYELIKEFGNLESDADGVELAFPSQESTTDEEEKDDDVEEVVEEMVLYDPDSPEVGHVLERTFSHVSVRRPSTATFKRIPLNFDKPSSGAKPTRTAQESEKMEVGSVKWSVYVAYAKACTYRGVLMFLLLILGSVSLTVAGDYWLKHWSEANGRSGANNNTALYIGVYVLLGLGAGLCKLVEFIVLRLYCTIKGSVVLHENMSQSILRSPMSFFETTPIGRIMNRFSNDINKVDEHLPRVFTMFFHSFFSAFSSLLVITVTVPQIVVIMLLVSLLYMYFQKFFRATSRQLKRMQSVALSPITAHLQETLNGRDTIVLFDDIARFRFLNLAHVDFSLKTFYIIRCVNRWLSARLQFLGSIIILSACCLAILTKLTLHPISAGLIGLAMNYALDITGSLNWIVRMSVEVETGVVSVERILDYSTLKSELPAVIESNRPPAHWPSKGEIKFVNYSTKYRANLDPVLKDISLHIEPEQKIGIVGRTGAGKSTLTSALYRLIEPTAGHIEIDGINTSEIGLYDLRHKLSIIPQDSQILEGTVKENLDPFDEYSDEKLWLLLKLSHLDEVIKAISDEELDEANKGLNVKMVEGGSNLSVGQRQLFCLARALLNESKILILDEATALVDVQTDKIIQETIRSEFKHKTILTIAHRLDTVMDSDKILVLDKGEVKEFDTPENLLKDTNGIFYSLCKQGGYLKA